MIFRLKLLTLNIATAILLIFFLCLGYQKENQEGYNLNFLGYESAKLPNGFLIGTSFSIGLISGGITSALLINNNVKEKNQQNNN
tara:strand:- start:1387 stop:1641 length:255 start_codon:yes stop_codon:yes gene_type:complete